MNPAFVIGILLTFGVATLTSAGLYFVDSNFARKTHIKGMLVGAPIGLAIYILLVAATNSQVTEGAVLLSIPCMLAGALLGIVWGYVSGERRSTQ